MSRKVYFGVLLVFWGMTLAVCAAAQSDPEVSLGDLARSLRQSKVSKVPQAPQPKESAAPTIIDNDNLTQVIEQVEHFRLGGKPMLSFDGAGKNFQMTSPDGTCSLSFNANATALLATPFVAEDLPPAELAKLDGPASIRDDTLEVSVYNASSWNVKEITVGLTIVRRADPIAADYGVAKLLPAVAETDSVQPEKRSDMTVLLHLKGSATPFATTVFREKLESDMGPDQEWHWAIVDAKGIPASPAPIDATNSSAP
jgi:hypothetical protein